MAQGKKISDVFCAAVLKTNYDKKCVGYNIVNMEGIICLYLYIFLHEKDLLPN